MSKTVYKVLTYADLDNSRTTFQGIHEELKVTDVVGISRGGLPVSVLASHELSVPMSIVNFQTMDGNDTEVDFCLNKLSNNNDPKHILICDDIFDSGLTIATVKDYFLTRYPDVTITCYALIKDEKYIEGDREYVNATKETHEWVVFPWEPIQEGM